MVDVDLEKFFDRANHDVLMGRVAKRIGDHRVLLLIRCYLNAGVMANGVVVERYEGTPSQRAPWLARRNDPSSASRCGLVEVVRSSCGWRRRRFTR